MIRVKIDENKADITDLVRIKKEYKLSEDEFLSMIRSNPDEISISVRDAITMQILIAAGIILKVFYVAKLEDQ